MNERVMQFRIGMFVIVAGLVLTMLIVWFGEGPVLFRDQRYLVVHYPQAPGVAEGIPVRKSGIRIGEVVSVAFDERPDQPDGVLVTLALESRFRLRAGSTPQIARGLIGDVWIDMLPGSGSEPLITSRTIEAAARHIVEGSVTPDPSQALAAATEAFANVKGTLSAIEAAANGLASITGKADNVDELIVSFRDAGQKVGSLAGRLDAMIAQSGDDLTPTLASFRQAADAFNQTLDEPTRANLRIAAQELANTTVQLKKLLVDLAPLAADLGGGPDRRAATVAGQTMARLSRIVYDVQLLSATLNDGQGRLNPNGTLQRLLTQPDLYNNVTNLSTTAARVVAGAERAVANLNRFAERIANDPSAITRGALSR
jgi:phospholipid/cholesterol/gamma-HCH transport system substrate-binding protein